MKLFGMSIKGLWYSGDLQSLRASVLLYQLVWSQFFLFFVWIPGFLILYGLMEKEFPVFHHYGYWLPFYMGWILFPSTALSFVVYKTINKYILYLASYFNLIYSLDSWTLGHFYFCFVCPQNMYIIWYGFKTTQDELAQF